MAVRDIEPLKIAFVEKYTLISWFSAILGVKVLGTAKCLCKWFFSSVKILTRLDSQSKFQMFNTLFFCRHIGGLQGGRLHTRLYNFARKLRRISQLSDNAHPLILENCPVYLSSIYNITISRLYPLNGFWFYCFYCVTMNTLYLSFLGVWILQQVVFADVIGLLFRFYLISSYYNHTNLRRKGIMFEIGQTV